MIENISITSLKLCSVKNQQNEILLETTGYEEKKERNIPVPIAAA